MGVSQTSLMLAPLVTCIHTWVGENISTVLFQLTPKQRCIVRRWTHRDPPPPRCQFFLKVHHWVLKSTLRSGSNFCLGFLGSFGARTKTLTIHHWQLHRPGSVSLDTGSLRGRFTLRRGTGATQRTAQDTRPPPGPPPAWPSVRLRGKSKLRNKQTGRQPHHLKLLPIIICRKCLIRILHFCTNLILLLTNILAFGSIWTRELNLANWRLQFATLAAAQSFQSQNWEEKQKWENMRPCACITKKAMLKMRKGEKWQRSSKGERELFQAEKSRLQVKIQLEVKKMFMSLILLGPRWNLHEAR